MPEKKMRHKILAMENAGKENVQVAGVENAGKENAAHDFPLPHFPFLAF